MISPSPRKRTAKKGTASRNTNDRIRSSALWLFAVRGVDSSSIRDIGGRARVPTSLLYHYAPSKLQLLFELMDDGIRRHLASSSEAQALAQTPEAQLFALVSAHILMHAKNRLMARLVNHEWRSLPAKRRVVILGLLDEINALWDATIARGVQAKIFHADDVKLARLALIEMCNGVSTWYSAAGRMSIDALALGFANLALGMLRAARHGKPLRSTDIEHPTFESIAAVVAEKHVGAVRETLE
jgi:AcrR family transcriptional regulator